MTVRSKNVIKEAAKLLRSEGKSYRQISQELNISKGTLSGWFRNNEDSNLLKISLTQVARHKAARQLKGMVKANKLKWALLNESYRTSAVEEFSGLKDRPLFVAGLAIYWGEGDKMLANSLLRVSNIDYKLLRTFIKFLQEIIGLPTSKIKASLLLYPDLDNDSSINYWSKKLRLPKQNFIKSQYIIGREKKKRLSNGVCTIYVCSRMQKEKVIKWTELLYNHLVEI